MPFKKFLTWLKNAAWKRVFSKYNLSYKKVIRLTFLAKRREKKCIINLNSIIYK